MSSVLCHWLRSGVSSRLRSKAENKACFPGSVVNAGREEDASGRAGGGEQAPKHIAATSSPSGASFSIGLMTLSGQSDGETASISSVAKWHGLSNMARVFE